MGVGGRDQAEGRCKQDRPGLMAGPIVAIPDAAVDDELPCPECEETGQVVVVVVASALPDSVAGSTDWSGEIQRYRIGV